MDSSFLHVETGPLNKVHLATGVTALLVTGSQIQHENAHAGQPLSPELWGRGLQRLESRFALATWRMETWLQTLGEARSGPGHRPALCSTADRRHGMRPLTSACVYFFWRKWRYFSNNFLS